ncbi:exonuclease domain-containing protein [uncultured Kriegella sp.]|uniref:exonuclease domain-containing protein n=1 Tax=uncultured Kriegella sp. TaxID=1798910 RepID=UPI0030D7E26B|tara:strand:+ start:353207 stop:354550 length:1344 start_codon:yes stop_codon:yes gene_type:complete
MYAILDIETTGGKYNEEGITEIAIHKFDGHEVIDKFISLVNPEKEIQPFVVNLTGINNKMLRTAPKFHEIAKRIVEVTQDAILVAHNAQFDYRILRTEFRRLGYNFERKTLCTVDLSKKLIPEAESHSLGKLVRSLGIPVTDRHRANGDALATLKLFKLLLAKDTDKAIIKDIVRIEAHGELSPRQLDIVQQMPSETGVFYVHNKDGDIIYLAKSSDIKKRVNQHFTKNGQKARKLQKETKKITFEKTGSELVALLKENEELSRNRPKYGRPRSQKLFSHAVYFNVNESGYQALTIERSNCKSQYRITTFNGLESANNFIKKVTEEFQLCPKLNGILDLETDCPKGASKETAAKYNERVKQVFDKYALNKKNIVIVDKGREVGEYSAILIKNGVFQGLGYYNLNHQINNIHILESIITPMTPSANAKHIIESYLRKRRVLKILELDI